MLALDVPFDQEVLIGDVRIKFKRKTGTGVRIAVDAGPEVPVQRVLAGTNTPVERERTGQRALLVPAHRQPVKE